MRPWPWHSSCPGGPPPPMSHRTRGGTVKTLSSRQPRFCDYCRRLVSGRDRSRPVCGSGMLMKKKICSRDLGENRHVEITENTESRVWLILSFFTFSHDGTNPERPHYDVILFRLFGSSLPFISILRNQSPDSRGWSDSLFILRNRPLFLLCDEHEWEWVKDECRNCRWMQPSYYLRSTTPQVWISIINGDRENLSIRQNSYHLA